MTEKPPVGETAEKGASGVKAKIPQKRKASRKKPTPQKARAKSKAARKNVGGRPAWQPSIADRTAVERMKFVGESEAMIAKALNVDVKTLRKACPHELSTGYATRRRQVIDQLFVASEKGNVSATNRLYDLGKISRAAAAIDDIVSGRGEKHEAAPKKAPAGKKEQRQEAAEQVTGTFAPPPAPKLVVNNP